MNIQPDDYCALVCRDPNRLRLVNAHPEVVEVIERCLETYSLDYDLYFKSKVTCAFKLHSQPFRRSGCSEDKTIKIKEICISILTQLSYITELYNKVTFYESRLTRIIANLDQRALAKIIAELEKISWKISINTDIGKQNTNSCIFFRKVVVLDQGKREKLSRDGDIFIFSPSGMGSILLIDVPQNIERDLVDSIGATCSMENYKLLETIDGVILTSRLNLKGFSWCSTGDQAIAVRKMILKVIQTARQYKYELVS